MVTSTGTFVSCKDYDDDVTELWDAINGQKTDLTAKVTAVESSITSLQSAQTALDTKIAEAKDVAEKAALEAQKTAIAAAAAELATAKGELEASIAKLQGATDKEIEAIKADVTKTVASIAEVDGKVIALQAFQLTTEETLKNLANADAALSTTLTTLEAEVRANAIAIGKNKEAVEAQVDALNAYIMSNDEAVGANKDNIDKILTELGKHQEVLDKLNAFDVKETQDAIDELMQKTQKLSEEITAINNTLEVLSAAIYKGVTHVALVTNNSVAGALDTKLELVSAEAVRTWNFGDKLPGAIPFEKGARSTFTDKFVIRISPTDAVVGKDNIKLINSNGADLTDLVVVDDVQKYNGILTTRGISETGLWEVSVKMDPEYKAEDFKAATQAKDKDGNYIQTGEENKTPVYIAYAVSLNTTLDAEKGTTSRNVVSEYDLEFTDAAKTTVSELKFAVDDKNIADIANRYDVKADYKWSDGAKAEPVFEGEGVNTEEDTQDSRDGDAKKAYTVTLNKPFTVKLGEYKDKVFTAENVRGFYVTIDYDRAGDSDTSEKVAWKKYAETIKGLNTVTETGSIDLTITDADALTDYICFRVYAVNHDGSLVDPDGKAFEIVVGEAAQELNAYSVEKTWTANAVSKISKAPVAEGVFAKEWLDKVETVEYVESEVDTVTYGTEESKKAFIVKYYAKDEADAEAKEFTKGVKAAEVKFISVETSTEDESIADYWYDDAKTYTRTLAFKNNRGQVLKTLKVNFKKVLPTFPSTFQAKVNQLTAEGTLDAFMNPVADTDPVKGNNTLTNSFNGLANEDLSVYDQNFTFKFAEADRNEAGEVEALKVSFDATNHYTFDVANEFIDSKKLHAVTVEYNFGEISSTAYGAKNGNDYIVTGGEFKNIIFSCLETQNDYTWTKNGTPKFKYGKTDATIQFSQIQSTNSRDGKYSITLDKLVTETGDNMISGLDAATYELWSQTSKGGDVKAGSKNEYFIPSYQAATSATSDKAATPACIKLDLGSNKQNPLATVYSTLIIKTTDYFGHEVSIMVKDLEVQKRE